MIRASLGALVLVLFGGCSHHDCLNDDANCHVPSPCPKVQLSCDAPQADKLEVFTLTGMPDRPLGHDAQAGQGDVMLRNANTEVVIAGIGNRRYLDPNGGSIVDFAAPGQATDGINNILNVIGILPGDAAHFTSLELIDERPNRVAVQVKGTLDGHPDIPIFTRYELQPCDQGVRVRTEIINGSKDTQLFALSDGFYWSKREAIPFTPGPGQGFVHPSFGLLSINDVYTSVPFMAASLHSSDQYNAYATISCTDATMEGFQSETVSAMGLPRTVVPVRGTQVFERYLAMVPDRSVAKATDLALEIRKQVTKHDYVTVHGKVVTPTVVSDQGLTERETTLQISEGSQADPVEKRTPWTEVVPAQDGTFSARVPKGKKYVVEVDAFGTQQIEKDFPVLNDDTDLGTFTVAEVAQVTFHVHDTLGAAPLDAEIFVVPADAATNSATTGTFFGQFQVCAPWLGPPPGASPACNRVLVKNGVSVADVPVGTFYVYAFHGPFYTLGVQKVTLTPGATSLDFVLGALPLQPAGTLNGDFHVHGAASFDSSIPDFDRVLSFSASGVQVIIATDHDIIHDYGEVVTSLGLDATMTVVDGIETTGHIPFLRIPNYGFPLVIGHYNFWPLAYDPSLPRNNGPDDELIEPGELFDRVNARKDPVLGALLPLRELNHPWAAAEFGRDLGFPRALSLDLRKDLPKSDDGTSGGIYVRTHNSTLGNGDHEAQEVMNGSINDTLLPYRTFWWYLLSQGQLKVGTANSDSHSLADDTIGLPRNIVYTTTTSGPGFDINVFNAAVRTGHLLGTNGPVIEATCDGDDGHAHDYGLAPFKPKAGGKLHVKVSSAPWIPVTELRFIVNGQVAKTVGSLPQATDPLGSTDLVRFDDTIDLDPLLAGVTGDAWLVIEAGTGLILAGDLGGGLDNALDGVPDTSDNNGDGVVDKKDVNPGDDVGPLNNPPAPADGALGFHFYNVTGGGYPFAFTNPFVFDRDGDGKFTGPGVKGGR